MPRKPSWLLGNAPALLCDAASSGLRDLAQACRCHEIGCILGERLKSSIE